MPEPASKAILSRLPGGPLVGAEIGVLRGHNAARLLSARPELLLYCVDNWTFGDLVEESPAEIRRQARANLKGYEDRVIWQEVDSIVAAAWHQQRSLDFVFVDASHDFESVMLDLESWAPTVKPGGWIMGHDYDHPRFPDVRFAVDQYMRRRPFEVDGLVWAHRV